MSVRMLSCGSFSGLSPTPASFDVLGKKLLGWPEDKVLLVNEVVLLQLPVRRREIAVVTNLVAVLDDAANLNPGHGEGGFAAARPLGQPSASSDGFPVNGTTVPSGWITRPSSAPISTLPT